jgi:hypothetical protein
MGNAQGTAGKARKGRKLRRVLLGLFVVVVALVALGPTIAGPLARPFVEGAVNDQIKGRATVGRLGLSWFGAQKVSLTLDDPAGGRVADVSVRADRGLLGLALGSRNLGVVYVGGSATIVRDADGSTNLQRAIEARFPAPDAAPAPKGEPARLPGSLGASLVLDGLTVTYEDAVLAEQTGGAVGAVRLGALIGSVDFAVGRPLGVSIKGPIATGRDGASLAESGSLDFQAQVTDLTDASGRVTAGAMGAELSLSLTAPAVEVRLHAGLADGAVVDTGETSVTVSVAELAEFLPALGAALAAQPGVTLDQLPTVTLGVERLRVPTGGDLRGASALVRLTTTAIGGTVELPDGETRSARPFGIEPLSLTVDAPSLGETVTVSGGTRATIGGESAGELAVNLAVGGLLDAGGKPRAGVPGSVSGGLSVKGFSTLILQPFVAAVNTALPAGLRLDLPQDLGPTVDLALGADSHTDGSGSYDIDLALDSQQAEIDAAVVISGQRIASRGEGVRARFTRLAPLVDRLTAAHGLRMTGGADLTVSGADFAVDLSKLKGEGGPDLRGARASVEVTLADAVGQLQLEGDDALRDLHLKTFTVGLSTDDVGGEVRVTAGASGDLDGEPFVAMSTDMTLSGLLNASGGFSVASLPALRGEVRLNAQALGKVDEILGARLAASGLVLAKDIGPSAEVLLLAASNPGAGANATDLDLTINSANLTVTAPLTATPDRLRTREPIVVVDRAAGDSLSRLLAGKGPVRVRPGAAARVSIAGLDVPIGEGGVRPDRVAAQITATVTDLVTDVELTDAAGKATAPGQVSAPRVVATLTAAPGSAPTVGVDAQLVHAEQPFTVTLAGALHGLFLGAPADAADPMSVVSVGTLRPEMQLALKDVPATLARLVPPGMVQVGGQPLDAVLVARDMLGRTFSARLATSPSPNAATITRVDLDLEGQGVGAKVRGRFDDRHIRVFSADARLGVTPRVAKHLTDLLAPTAPVKPALAQPAEFRVALGSEFDVPLGAGHRPDLASLSDVLELTLTADASLTALTLPAKEGAEPMTIPALTISGLTVGLKAPGAVMSAGGAEAEATLGGRVLGADGASLVGLSGTGRALLKGGKPAGPMPVSLTLGEIAAPWIDGLLGKPSLVEGALGERFSLTLNADPNLLRARDPKQSAVSLAVQSARLSTTTPLSLSVGGKSVFLSEVTSVRWVMGPRWANQFLLGAEPGGPKPAFAFTEQTPVTLDLRRLALAFGEGAGPFKQDLFLVDLTATVPSLPAELSDGRKLAIGDLEFRLGRGPTPDQLGFALTVPRMKLGDGAEMTPTKNRVSGRVASFADAEGNLTPDAARLDVSGGLAPIPTEVIDAFARQNGLLRDALGPTVDFDINAQGFSKSGGTLAVKATTPLATASISGKVGDGLFVVDPKVSTIRISQITPELTKRFQKALPVVATIEKSGEDEPAVVTFDSPLELPIDGNMDRLNGKLTIDLGTAKFGTADLFQRVLALAQQKTAGEVGRRMPPLKVTMDKGLVSYEPFALPFGEFKIESAGFINLSSAARSTGGSKQLPAGQLEVLTFIPAGAFAAEAVPGLASLPLPVVGNMARLPVRTNGLIAAPSNNIAMDLVGQEAINELNPGKLFQDLLGGDR